VRNLVKAGVSEKVAMTMTGYKTRAVFDRHHIIRPGDVQRAAALLDGRPLAERERAGSTHISPTVLALPRDGAVVGAPVAQVDRAQDS
jgi:hypothetical protein